MVVIQMPSVTTLRAPTTVHANRDLLETEETAAKVRFLSSLSLLLSSPLESFTSPLPRLHLMFCLIKDRKIL